MLAAYAAIAATITSITCPSPDGQIQGRGNARAPYVVCDEADWRFIEQQADTDSHVMLANDIELTSPPGGFDNSRVFRGVLDGDGHTVSYSIDETESQRHYVGLIGYAFRAKIYDIIVKAQMRGFGSSYHGCLVGRAEHSSIERVTIDCDFDGRDQSGGLVGFAANSTIDHIKGKAKVKIQNGNDDVGGVVGYARSSTISRIDVTVDMVASGDQSGAKNVGLLFGSLDISDTHHAVVRGSMSVSESIGPLDNFSIFAGSVNGGEFRSIASDAAYDSLLLNVVSSDSTGDIHECAYSSEGGQIGEACAPTIDLRFIGSNGWTDLGFGSQWIKRASKLPELRD